MNIKHIITTTTITKTKYVFSLFNIKNIYHKFNLYFIFKIHINIIIIFYYFFFSSLSSTFFISSLF